MTTKFLKRLALLTALLGGAVLTGVSATGQSISPSAPQNLRITSAAVPKKLACIGDSITFGYQLPSDQSYPANLQRLLGSGYDVRNFGRNGATVLMQGDNPYWNMDLFQTSSAFLPDIAVIMLGTNDSKPNNWGPHSAEFEGDYTQFVKHYQALGATVYVAIPPPAQADFTYWQVDQVVPHVRNVIQATGAFTIDVNQAMSNLPQYFQDDVHPNAAGAAFLAQVIYTAVHR
jgi:sialate O-acetylesterase